MRAVLLGGGTGTGLSPLTSDIPPAMVPVLDRPLLGHTVELLRRQGIDRVAVAVGRRGEVIARHFGPALEYRRDDRTLGAAGAAASCRDFIAGETFIAIAGEVLTDLDAGRLAERHRETGAVATLCVARMEDPLGHTLVDADADGRVRSMPGPGSELAFCGILAAEPSVLEPLHPGEALEWADVVAVLLERDAPVFVHMLDEYCLDVDTPERLRQATFDLMVGRVALPVAGEEIDEGLTLGAGSSLDGIAMVEPPVWIGADVQIGEHARLQGPLAIGDEATIGDGAQLRASVILPGSSVPRETILIDAVAGHARMAQTLPRR
jgi:NDP-sugar pyrophosphorylase family protein